MPRHLKAGSGKYNYHTPDQIFLTFQSINIVEQYRVYAICCSASEHNTLYPDSFILTNNTGYSIKERGRLTGNGQVSKFNLPLCRKIKIRQILWFFNLIGRIKQKFDRFHCLLSATDWPASQWLRYTHRSYFLLSLHCVIRVHAHAPSTID